MATVGYVERLLGGLPNQLRRVFTEIFKYLLRNLRFGTGEDQTASENFQAYFYTATTPAVANTEFSIVHKLGRTPYLLVGQVLRLNIPGEKIVRLEVSRAADSQRIYLKSPDVNAPIRIMVEA